MLSFEEKRTADKVVKLLNELAGAWYLLPETIQQAVNDDLAGGVKGYSLRTLADKVDGLAKFKGYCEREGCHNVLKGKGSGHKQRFCSADCRTKWHNEQKRGVYFQATAGRSPHAADTRGYLASGWRVVESAKKCFICGAELAVKATAMPYHKLTCNNTFTCSCDLWACEACTFQAIANNKGKIGVSAMDSRIDGADFGAAIPDLADTEIVPTRAKGRAEFAHWGNED